MTRPRIVVLGAGDLGLRIAQGLVAFASDVDVAVAGRSSARMPPSLRFHSVDLMDTAAVELVFRIERPDVIVQAGCLLSPWALPRRTDEVAQTLLEAGFATQISAQLPLLLSVMRAQRAVDASIPVVNCSYPDVTHPMLAGLGLAPSIGIGNASMIHHVVLETLRARDLAPPLVRVLGHHAHVTQVIRGDASMAKGTSPLVFLGEEGVPASELAYAGRARASNQELNALSAATAVPLVCALLPNGAALRTSAPGPLGLGGGYPVRVSREAITLDLPEAVSRDLALRFEDAAAREDGVGGIDADGTLYYTDEARALVKTRAPGVQALLEPLRPEDAMDRFGLLRDALGIE